MHTFTEFLIQRDRMMIVESMFDSPYLFKEMAILNPSSISKIGNLNGDITAKEIWNYVQYRDSFSNV